MRLFLSYLQHPLSFCFNPICVWISFVGLFTFSFCDPNKLKTPLDYLPTGKAKLDIANIGPKTQGNAIELKPISLHTHCDITFPNTHNTDTASQ